MTVIYMTKYALSDGIRRHDVDLRQSRVDSARYVDMGHCFFAYESRDFVLNETEAVSRAEAMRAKKIASLRKQIKRLEEMTFPIKSGATK